MKNSSRPNFGSDRRIVYLFSSACLAFISAYEACPAMQIHAASALFPFCGRPGVPYVLGHLPAK
jgi:hypothetical protein